MIKKYIDEIVENGSTEYMDCLSNIFQELMIHLKDCDKDKYHEYKMKLFGMAHDFKMDEDLSHKLVSEMTPLGEVWDLSTTNTVKTSHSLTDISDYDFYLVMNSLANDYSSAIPTTNVDLYTKLAQAFINDEDACENKVWKYFTTIPE